MSAVCDIRATVDRKGQKRKREQIETIRSPHTTANAWLLRPHKVSPDTASPQKNTASVVDKGNVSDGKMFVFIFSRSWGSTVTF